MDGLWITREKVVLKSLVTGKQVFQLYVCSLLSKGASSLILFVLAHGYY